jgi:hypothetical protein
VALISFFDPGVAISKSSNKIPEMLIMAKRIIFKKFCFPDEYTNLY